MLDYEISSLITRLIITCANSIKITNCNGVCLLSSPIHPYTPWLLLSCCVGPSLSSIFWERGLVLMVSCCFFCCREQEQKVHDIRSNVKDVIVVSSVQSSGTVHSFMDDGSICMMSFYCSALMPLTPHLPTSSLLTPHFSPPSSLIPPLHSSPPHYNIQTVTQEMSRLVPPISLGNSENKDRLRYIQEEVVRPDFVFTQVSWHQLPYPGTTPQLMRKSSPVNQVEFLGLAHFGAHLLKGCWDTE